MNLLEIFDLKELAEFAKKAYKEKDRYDFDKLIEIIVDIPKVQFDVRKLIRYIDPNMDSWHGAEHPFDNSWYDKLLLMGIKNNRIYLNKIDFYKHLILFGHSTCSVDEAKKILIDDMIDYFNIGSFGQIIDFYDMRDYFVSEISKTEGSNGNFNLIPKIFILDGLDTHAGEFIRINEDSHPLQIDSENELYIDNELVKKQENETQNLISFLDGYCRDDDYKMEIDCAAKQQNEVALANSPYKNEELLYQSCLNDEKEYDHPDMSKLESAKSSSSKAWYLLLYMQQKHYSSFYLDSRF